MLERIARRAAARGLGNVRVVHGAVESAAEHLQPGERFDRAFLVTVLGEVPDRGAALRALHEVLRPGGVLSVTEVPPRSPLPEPAGGTAPRGGVRGSWVENPTATHWPSP